MYKHNLSRSLILELIRTLWELTEIYVNNSKYVRGSTQARGKAYNNRKYKKRHTNIWKRILSNLFLL